MAPHNEKETGPTGFIGFVKTPRRILYALAWSLLFALTVAELGLVSQQLHRGGNSIENYGNRMFKHDLGLLLFTIILTLLITVGHFFAGVAMMAFWTLVAAVFWGTGAGVMFQTNPYRSFNCGDADPASRFPGTRWGEQQFFSQCSRIVAIQGIAWANWGLLLIMFVGMLIHLFQIRVRPNTSFYRV